MRQIAVWSSVVPFENQPKFGAYIVDAGDDELSHVEYECAALRARMFDPEHRGRHEAIDLVTAGLVRH